MRVVFDTNVLISALLLKKSVSRQALDTAIQYGTVLISAPTITEFKVVMQRKGFDKYITEQERADFLIALVRDSILVQTPETVKACRDPKDDKFLDLAVHGAAKCIVVAMKIC